MVANSTLLWDNNFSDEYIIFIDYEEVFNDFSGDCNCECCIFAECDSG